jgi:hypothetical protein
VIVLWNVCPFPKTKIVEDKKKGTSGSKYVRMTSDLYDNNGSK